MNKIAYYRIGTLRIRNVFIVQTLESKIKIVLFEI
jgi:hypothetical protein